MAGSSYTDGTGRAFGLAAFTKVRMPADGRPVLHATPTPTWADGYESVPAPIVDAGVDMLLRYATFGDDDAFDQAVRGAGVLESRGRAGRIAAGLEEDVTRELAACIAAANGTLEPSNLRLMARLGWFACFDGQDDSYMPPCTYDQAVAMSSGTLESMAALVERASEMVATQFGGLSTYGISLRYLNGEDTYVDYLTGDGTLLDLVVDDLPISNADALRLMSYYLLGRIEARDFAPIRRLGIVNPRLNCLWYCDVRKITDAWLLSVFMNLGKSL